MMSVGRFFAVDVYSHSFYLAAVRASERFSIHDTAAAVLMRNDAIPSAPNSFSPDEVFVSSFGTWRVMCPRW